MDALIGGPTWPVVCVDLSACGAQGVHWVCWELDVNRRALGIRPALMREKLSQSKPGWRKEGRETEKKKPHPEDVTRAPGWSFATNKPYPWKFYEPINKYIFSKKSRVSEGFWCLSSKNFWLLCSGKGKIISVEHDEKWTNEAAVKPIFSQQSQLLIHLHSPGPGRALSPLLPDCSQRQSPPRRNSAWSSGGWEEPT